MKFLAGLKRYLRENRFTARFYNRLYNFRYSLLNVGDTPLMKHFKAVIKRYDFTNALDAGCGYGKYCFYLSKTLPSPADPRMRLPGH